MSRTPRPLVYRGKFNDPKHASEGSTDQDSEAEGDETNRLMGSDDEEPQSIQIDVPQMSSRSGSTGGAVRPRMGRRFTLNPLIFAKEEREARRLSLAQLKLSYYPKNANRKFYFF